MSTRGRSAVVGLVLLWRSVAGAAGPLLITDGGRPFRWPGMVVFHHDRGRLGMLGNARAVALVEGGFGVWEAVGSSSIAFRNGGALAVNVRERNYATYLTTCNGTNPIIFDADGSITDDLLGIGARNVVLGFASPVCGDPVSGDVTHAVAVMNGRWVDGVASRRNPELAVEQFRAVFVHEFGHFVNLDHSQVNRTQGLDGEPTNDGVVPTMFPVLTPGSEAATLTVDDIASVSSLYPGPDVSPTTGTITGQVIRGGEQPFQGAYVIARRVDSPLETAVGYASGARFPPAATDPTLLPLRGLYEIRGLPPGTYSIEVEAIDPGFTGGSSVGPLDPPPVLPGGPEYWSGELEAATAPPDDPGLVSTVAVLPGATVTGIDIRLNEPSLANDLCASALVVPGVPHRAGQETDAATTSADDPPQTCTSRGPAVNRASVWFMLTPPGAGRIVMTTAGSAYDTVLSAYRGACGALVPIACSDDTEATVQSRLDLDLDAGETVLVEVTAFGDTPAGRLELALQRGCSGSGACDDGDPCTSGDRCVEGICVGPAATCDDANVCTTDVCDAAGSCVTSLATGPCEDGDVCTVEDACVAAQCVGGRPADGATAAQVARAPLPPSCSTLGARHRSRVLKELGKLAARIERGVVVGRPLGALERRVHRLEQPYPICAAALAMRLERVWAQLACLVVPTLH